MSSLTAQSSSSSPCSPPPLALSTAPSSRSSKVQVQRHWSALLTCQKTVLSILKSISIISRVIQNEPVGPWSIARNIDVGFFVLNHCGQPVYIRAIKNTLTMGWQPAYSSVMEYNRTREAHHQIVFWPNNGRLLHPVLPLSKCWDAGLVGYDR